jgi:predicted RecB family nuclease
MNPFSQSSLQDYVDCARRFELRYLMQLRYPAVEAEPLIEHERHMRLGDDFHRLVYQHLVGVPVEKLTASLHHETIRRWWENYLKYHLPAGQRHAELKLFARLAGHRLVAKYDLLVRGEKFTIVDWKTSTQRTKRERLLERLQTLVYRYVLVEAGTYLNGGAPIQPEQIEMIYWFPEYPHDPEIFDYDTAQHQQVEQYLTSLIREIEARSTFELTPVLAHCRYCTYRSLCERGAAAGDLSEFEAEAPDDAPLRFDFDQIAEVEF